MGNRNAGLRETEKPKLGRCHKLPRRRGTCWPLTFLARVGLGLGRDLIKLEAARSLTICDVGGRSFTKGKTNQRILSWGL